MNEPKHWGFTGTRISLRKEQHEKLLYYMKLFRPEYLHHGCCVGADQSAHRIGVNLGCKLWGHPGDTHREDLFPKEEFFTLEENRPYLERNSAIVAAVDILIACPRGEEELRSGTWSTVRRARTKGIPILYIRPDGSDETIHHVTTKVKEKK